MTTRPRTLRREIATWSLLLAACLALLAPAAVRGTVQIGVHAEDHYGKAYLTWAPVQAWARLAEPGAEDVVVVLTNDAGAGEKTPCGHRVDGDLAFSAAKPPQGQTATAAQLELTLPASGDPVAFFLAGGFPQASTEDGDAVIEVHQGAADGPVIARRELMVRIRKEVKCLTKAEWTRFAEAIHDLHFEQHAYWPFVEIHDWAARGKLPRAFQGKYPLYPDGKRFPFPDQAHGGPRGPAFLPWHRTYLLQFERLLQETSPAIALPYWPVNLKNSETGVFTPPYLGSNPSSGGGTVEPTFTAGHPLEHWQMPGDDNPNIWQPIQRTAYDRDNLSRPDFTPFTDSQIFQSTTFRFFARNLETNPHNIGHNWIGPWMQNCRVSPRDPIFWVFHTWFDMMWGQWQHKYNRFGSDVNDYAPQGKHKPGTVPIGHYAEDTMWPWNGVTGPPGEPQEDPPTPDYNLSRPPVSPTGPFAPSGVPGIWPQSPAQPTPVSMVDYAGIGAANMDRGFAYDKIPFGSKVTEEEEEAPHLRMLMDESQPHTIRIEAVKRIDLLGNEEHAAQVSAVVQNREAHESLRAASLMRLTQIEHPDAHAQAVKVLTDAEDGGEELDLAAVGALSVLTMFTSALTAEEAGQAQQALRGALRDDRAAVRISAMETLAERKDPEAIALLRDALDGEGEPRFPPRASILQLASATGEQSFDTIRPYLSHPDGEVRAAAVSVLGADPASRRQIEFLLRDPGQPHAVRTAAIGALLYHDPNFAEVAFEVIEDPDTSGGLRASLIRALKNHSSKLNPAGLPEDKLAAIRERLAELE